MNMEHEAENKEHGTRHKNKEHGVSINYFL